MADIPVRGVYLYFKELEQTKTSGGTDALESFLVECDQKQLTVQVSDTLYAVGESHLRKRIGVKAVGPKCPACPNPPRI